MNENAKKFFEILSKDEALVKKVCAMTEMEEIIALAEELGCKLTEADFETPEQELSEAELKDVAGGDETGGCFCLLAGGGGGTQFDGDIYGCACVAYGQGGDGAADDFTCWCTGAGSGVIDDAHALP